jgi:hypothetical protein
VGAIVAVIVMAGAGVVSPPLHAHQTGARDRRRREADAARFFPIGREAVTLLGRFGANAGAAEPWQRPIKAEGHDLGVVAFVGQPLRLPDSLQRDELAVLLGR